MAAAAVGLSLCPMAWLFPRSLVCRTAPEIANRRRLGGRWRVWRPVLTVPGHYIDLARGGKVALSLEPEPNFVIGTTVDAIAMIEKFKSQRLGLTTDIGHVNCSEDDYLGAIERAIPYTLNIHIEDIRRRVHHHEIPGEGDIDFTRVFEILHKAGYQHSIAVELHHHNDRIDSALHESLAYLNRFRSAA